MFLTFESLESSLPKRGFGIPSRKDNKRITHPLSGSLIMPSIFLPQTPLGLDTQQAISSLEHRPPVSLKVNKKWILAKPTNDLVALGCFRLFLEASSKLRKLIFFFKIIV